MDLTSGTLLGRYEIRSKIGEGGMGDVYLAEDTKLNRKVAIKFLPDEKQSRNAGPRFVREAKLAAKLDHPNICAIYEVGEEDGCSFIVMQYINGETLADTIRIQPPTLSESLVIATQIAEALAEAHAHGVVHRDIKPGNIRSDLDRHRIGFFGPSSGARIGLILAAVENRYASISLVGSGVPKSFRDFIPAANITKFASHIRAPKIMIHGKYDENLPLKTAAEPLFKLLSEPKRLVIYDGGHVPPFEFMVPTMSGWFDETLGPVKH